MDDSRSSQPGPNGHGSHDEIAGLSPDCDPSLDAITAHIERHLGKIEYVWHEMISDVVHIDVHVVFPTEERPYHTLVTSGMSDLPMNVPPEIEDLRYAELLIRLPADWNLAYETLNDERNYWPIRWLKNLARLPHLHRTWLGVGHTVPNGDPPQSLAPETDLCGILVTYPYIEGPEFVACDARPDKRIHFYSLMPLFESEMRHKIEHGADSLEDLFEKSETSLIVDPVRAPAI